MERKSGFEKLQRFLPLIAPDPSQNRINNFLLC
jgi:hypothetical protein